MQNDLFKTKASTAAVISECGLYRYSLSRIWDAREPYALFIMLNPSTADDVENDPTITRCIKFALDWGYGGLKVVNLFALRSTDPAALRHFLDPIGPENDSYIKQLAEKAGIIITAWGNNGEYKDRGNQVLKMLSSKKALRCMVFHFGLTNKFQPKHPLYIPGDSRLIKWDADIQEASE